MSAKRANIESTRETRPTTSSEGPHIAYVETNEQHRLNETREKGVPWKKWGPYLSERQWGRVREDYCQDGYAWDYFSHEQAPSRAYRWGRRPVYGGIKKFHEDPHWKDYILFYEYFHGDNGAGLGASHQAGWTGIIARTSICLPV